MAQLVISSMLAYCIQHLWLPERVCDQINAAIRRVVEKCTRAWKDKLITKIEEGSMAGILDCRRLGSKTLHCCGRMFGIFLERKINLR